MTVAPSGPVASTPVMSACEAMFGAVVSRIVTLNLALEVLPLASEAEQVTSVRPKGKVEPESGEQLTVRLPSTASVAVGMVKITVAPA